MSLSHLASVLLGQPGPWRYVRIIVYAFVLSALLRLIPIPYAFRRIGGARPKPRRRRRKYPLWIGVPLVIVLALGVGAWRLRPATAEKPVADGSKPSNTVTHASRKPAPATEPTAPYVGVFEPGALTAYSKVTRFASVIGQQPSIVLSYSAWNVPFQTRFARTIRSGRAIPFMQMMPQDISVPDITSGRYDKYLRSFAASVHQFGHQVLLGFGPEMEGNWYPWGRGHLAPSDYVQAWRHVVQQFRAAGAQNVVWVWTVNNVLRGYSGPSIRQWWPGSSYVTWVGIDGYYYKSGDTFNNVFGYTLQQLHRFTHKPILIAETAVGNGTGAARPTQIRALFRGVSQNHLLGLVWFDEAQNSGLYHQDWRLEGNKVAISAFRTGIRSMLGRADGGTHSHDGPHSHGRDQQGDGDQRGGGRSGQGRLVYLHHLEEWWSSGAMRRWFWVPLGAAAGVGTAVVAHAIASHHLPSASQASIAGAGFLLLSAAGLVGDAVRRYTWGEPDGQESAAIVVLLIGGVILPFFGWLFGVYMLWKSPAWTAKDKLIGTFVLPGGLLFAIVGAFLTFTGSGSCADLPPAPNAQISAKVSTFCTGTGDSPLFFWGSTAAVAVLTVAPIFTALRLHRRAQSLAGLEAGAGAHSPRG